LNRLFVMGVQYGDHPAHNGLWDAAIATKDNFAARLAIAPLVLEARGLDVTPAMIDKLRSVNDMKSAEVLNVIYTEEVRHVAIGRHWFGIVANLVLIVKLLTKLEKNVKTFTIKCSCLT